MKPNTSLRIPLTFLPIVLIFLALSGCKKFLDSPNQGSYTEDDYPYPTGAGPYDPFIFGAYNDLRSYNVHADGFIAATSIRSDDADKGSTPADGGADVISMDNFPVLPSSGRANALWKGYYGLITKCNQTIFQVDSNRNIPATEAVKVLAKAEARFLRGYAYFNLVRFFGRVPKFDRFFENPAEQNNIPQSSTAALYTFIEEDLTYAAQNLPDSWEPKFIGRVTRAAAHGLLAKVYITQQKWSLAQQSAQLVISSGLYDLSTTYDKIFTEEGENSKESIFEIQATASASEREKNGIQYASIQGVRGANNWNLGWGWNVPSAQLEAAYEPNDPRKARTILYASTSTQEGYSLYNEKMPLYPTEVPNPRYNHKVLGSPNLRNTISRASWWMNVRILRYADVVLMYAEAANELGQTAEALQALNQVRERARRGAPDGTLPDITATGQEELRQSIRHERRIELAMEHERFFDIVRWGIAESVFHAAGKPNYQDFRDKLLPIPTEQIDLSKNVLTQNPGY